MRSLDARGNNMNQNKTTISAVVIAKNEEQRIEKCLESLTWADELLVIDNDSTDKTAQIAKQSGATVISTKTHDFAVLRNIGKDRAKGDWILYVDADEIVSDALRNEILEHIKRTAPVAFYIHRKNYYYGHLWPYRDKMQRLFLKSALRSWHGAVHETATVNGPVGTLTSPLDHDTHRTLEEMLVKTNEWSETEAKLRLDANHPPVVWWRLLRVMITGFFDSYIGQGGWRAGTVGLIESMYQSYSMFVTYAKLWELQNRK